MNLRTSLKLCEGDNMQKNQNIEKKDVWISPGGIFYVSDDLIKAIQSFPVSKEVKHCNTVFSVSPFDIYGTCPQCKTKIKLMSFSGNYQLEDVFDAVFEWLIKPEVQKLFEKRQREIIEDRDE